MNPYDASKACAEVLVRSYRETFGLDVAVARCANIYGGGDLNFSRLIPGTIRSVLKGERPILRSDGSPVRDFLYVDDAVAAYLTLGEQFAQLGGNGYAFNFGGGQPISVLEMLRMVLEACDSEDVGLDIRGEGVPPAEIDRQFLDSTLAGLILGWQAAVGLDVGLERTVTWYRQFMRIRQMRPSRTRLRRRAHRDDRPGASRGAADCCGCPGSRQRNESAGRRAQRRHQCQLSPRCGSRPALFPGRSPANRFREVWCHDILEHLPDTVATMEEIHRVSRPGARIFVTTPHFSCANAFTDPTHCHQFGMFSFDFFTGSAVHPYYTDKRFTYVKRLLVFHPSHINALIRRVANRWPAFYERHLCWIQPAFFMSIELAVRK